MTAIQQIGQTGDQAGCKEVPQGEDQVRALGELGYLSGRFQGGNREESRQLGLARTSAYRTEGARDPETLSPRHTEVSLDSSASICCQYRNQTSARTSMAGWEGKSLVWLYQHELCCA